MTIDGRITASIGAGLLLLVGFTHSDQPAGLEWMADKITGLRIFADSAGKMNRSVTDIGGALLVVSQFTLYGEATKGKRPSFIEAARPEQAIPLYDRFISLLRERVASVETGEFGADMKVALVNEGPVTLMIDR